MIERKHKSGGRKTAERTLDFSVYICYNIEDELRKEDDAFDRSDYWRHCRKQV